MWSLQALISFAAWIWQFDGPECESRGDILMDLWTLVGKARGLSSRFTPLTPGPIRS